MDNSKRKPGGDPMFVLMFTAVIVAVLCSFTLRYLVGKSGPRSAQAAQYSIPADIRPMATAAHH